MSFRCCLFAYSLSPYGVAGGAAFLPILNQFLTLLEFMYSRMMIGKVVATRISMIVVVQSVISSPVKVLYRT
jgi:hypothetical protein